MSSYIFYVGMHACGREIWHSFTSPVGVACLILSLIKILFPPLWWTFFKALFYGFFAEISLMLMKKLCVVLVNGAPNVFLTVNRSRRSGKGFFNLFHHRFDIPSFFCFRLEVDEFYGSRMSCDQDEVVFGSLFLILRLFMTSSGSSFFFVSQHFSVI